MNFYGTTDIGKKRTVNQDNFRIKEYSPEVTLAVVCDGMGGAKAGGVASSLAVSSFVECVDEAADVIISDYEKPNADEIISEVLLKAVERANDAVFTSAATSAELTGMGTTLVCALVTPKSIYGVNVGDSRAYCIDGEGIQRLSVDHSLVQLMVDRGELTPERARTYPGKNFITRAIGTEPMVECDIFHRKIDRGDCLLLCSDGLSNMMDDQEILFEVAHGVHKEHCCQRLLDIAKNRGAPDNVTSVLITV